MEVHPAVVLLMISDGTNGMEDFDHHLAFENELAADPSLLSPQSLNGSDVNLAHLAVTYNQIRKLELLIDRNPALLDSISETGNTPMHFAVMGKHVHLVQWLIQRGSKALEIPNRKGEFPIHLAAKYGRMNIVQFMISVNSKLAIHPNGNGKLPVQRALKLQLRSKDTNLEIVRYLWSRSNLVQLNIPALFHTAIRNLAALKWLRFELKICPKIDLKMLRRAYDNPSALWFLLRWCGGAQELDFTIADRGYRRRKRFPVDRSEKLTAYSSSEILRACQASGACLRDRSLSEGEIPDTLVPAIRYEIYFDLSLVERLLVEI